MTKSQCRENNDEKDYGRKIKKVNLSKKGIMGKKKTLEEKEREKRTAKKKKNENKNERETKKKKKKKERS